MEIFKVEDLSFSYPNADKNAVDKISFGLERGDFLCVCGSTGSGKSTLLRLLKKELNPKGILSGKIMFDGRDINSGYSYADSSKIGFVMQRPEEQIVTDKVWHELSFGPENLGWPKDVIRRRVAEIAGYFGMEEWFEMNTDELSGGRKQLLNLAAVMVMQPEVLILDEPTAQLDPIAAHDFLSTISRLNREFSLTVIIVEHRLEDILPYSNKMLVLEEGRKHCFGLTREVLAKEADNKNIAEAFPAAFRIFAATKDNNICSDKVPLTVTEGRRYITDTFDNRIRRIEKQLLLHSETKALEIKNVYFSYDRKSPDVLKNLNCIVYEGEIFCILGGNGSGKSTALNVSAGLLKPYYGCIRVFNKAVKDYKNGSLYRNCLAMLPQDVQTLFIENTVFEELEPDKRLPIARESEKMLLDYIKELKLMYKHPYDLSGGEQQLVALTKCLAAEPKLLLMDEPTKGLDAHLKNRIASVLRKLKANGMTIVIVTHDVEFAANIADRCAMLFRGEITSCAEPEEFFEDNSFYTTAVNRMSRNYYDGAITVEALTELCTANRRKTNDF